MQNFVFAAILTLSASAAHAQGYVGGCKAEKTNDSEMFNLCVYMEEEALPLVEKYIAANKGTNLGVNIAECIATTPNSPSSQLWCIREQKAAIQQLQKLQAEKDPAGFNLIYATCALDWGPSFVFIHVCVRDSYSE